MQKYPEIVISGKIILLVDGITFSATDAFALFCKETKFAEIYGTPTGGDGISDSPIFYVLPNSKLVIRFTPAKLMKIIMMRKSILLGFSYLKKLNPASMKVLSLNIGFICSLIKSN